MLGPGGREWSDATIREVLDRGIYSGVIVRNRVKMVGEPGDRTHVRQAEPDWNLVESDIDFHPLILPYGTYFGIREIRRERQTQGRRPSMKSVFTGRLNCGACGATMHVRWWQRKGETVYSYRCQQRCGEQVIYEEVVMRAVNLDLYLQTDEPLLPLTAPRTEWRRVVHERIARIVAKGRRVTQIVWAD